MLTVGPMSQEESDVIKAMTEGLYLVTESNPILDRHWHAELHKLRAGGADLITEVPDAVFNALKKRNFLLPVAVTTKFRSGMAQTTWIYTSAATMALEGFEWQTVQTP